MKIAQGNVADFDRSRKDVEATIQRKDTEIKAMALRFEDEQTLVGKIQNRIKESQGRIEELEEELKGERQFRNQAERQRSANRREKNHSKRNVAGLTCGARWRASVSDWTRRLG